MRWFANKVSPSGATIHMPSSPVSTIHWYSVSLSRNLALSICIVFTIVMDSPPHPCQASRLVIDVTHSLFADHTSSRLEVTLCFRSFLGAAYRPVQVNLERFANQL